MYRKRYIPNEIKSLNDDEILFIDEDMIVTKWKTFKPKKEFTNGISCTFMNRGYKISRFMKDNGELVYYYCDIIHSDYYADENKWVFTDLLADVKIYPDGMVEIVDLEEVSYAYKNGFIDADIMCELFEKLDSLLKLIYSGKWKEIADKYLN